MNAEDTRCRPRPVMKTVAKVYVAAFPRTVTVSECSGFDEADDILRHSYKCLPTELKEYSVTYKKGMGLYEDTEHFVNHTKCEMKCVCELNGYECPTEDKYEDEAKIPCPIGLTWNKELCECQPVCKGNVEGPSKDGIDMRVFVASLAGEFIMIAIVLFAIYCCRNYQKQRTRSSSSTVNEEIEPEKINLNGCREQTGSVSIMMGGGGIVKNNHC